MQHITVVYDCPQKTCDKAWVYECVQQFFPQAKSVYAKGILASLSRRNKLKYVYVLMDLLICSIKQSRQADIVIIWGKRIAILLNVYFRIFSPKTKIISFNWLTPSLCKSVLTGWALTNPNFIAIVNDKNSISLYKQRYNLQHTRNFCYLPDVYDSNTPFVSNNTRAPQSAYFFTGGMNNRDFGLILKVARKFPNHEFVIIALKKDWQFKPQDIPSNVTVKFDTTSKEYYQIMSNARAVLLPLLDNRVAGLINIAKAIQFGTLCVVSRTPASQIYFANSDYLIEIGSLESLEQAICRIEKLTPAEYQQEIIALQKYLKENFAPCIIIEQLLSFSKEYFLTLNQNPN